MDIAVPLLEAVVPLLEAVVLQQGGYRYHKSQHLELRHRLQVPNLDFCGDDGDDAVYDSHGDNVVPLPVYWLMLILQLLEFSS